MKLVTYVRGGSPPRVGVLRDDGVRDAGHDGDMVSFIAAGGVALERASQTSEGVAPLEDVRLLAPLRPRSLRDFLAFEGHLQQVMQRLNREPAPEWYEVPSYYKGLPDTVIGPEEVIPWPSYSERLDHELELAAIIGREGRDVSRDDAAGFIYGWTIWNDMSARDVQTNELPIGMGPAKAKDWDGSNVLGPCIVTSDELDARSVKMSVRVNGEEWGSDNSSNMYHTFEDMIAYASMAQTLYPGEVFGSGTAAGGSGIEIDRWLEPGDLVEMEVQGIGVLRNRIGERKDTT